MVGDAQIARLALLDDVVERFEGFLDRRLVVGMMKLKEIDVICLEQLEAALKRVRDVSAAVAAMLFACALGVHLRRDLNFVAAAIENLAEESLAVAVALSGVDEVDA